MKILITGGTGFVGTNLSYYFVENYPRYTVLGVDTFTSSTQENITPLLERRNYGLMHGTISDKDFIEDILTKEQPDIIINTINTIHENEYVSTITYGTHVLLEAVRKKLPNIQAFIQISSDEVYGSTVTPHGNVRPGIETDYLNPITPHGAAEAGADLLVTSYYHAYKIPTTVIRPSCLFGLYQRQDKTIPSFIIGALQNKDIPIHGLVTQNWLYIDDFVELLDTVVHSRSDVRAGEIYNAAGASEYSTLEVAQLILTTLNKPAELISFIENGQKSQITRLLDSSRAQKAFGWLSQKDFKQALSQTIDWYKQELGA